MTSLERTPDRRCGARPVSRGPVAAALAAVAFGAVGCVGEFKLPDDGGVASARGGDAGSPLAPGGSADLAPASPRARFEGEVMPLLAGRCAACHGRDGSVGPSFMKDPAYDTIVGWPGVVSADPRQSRLVTKGPHNGAQWFTDAEIATILGWLGTETGRLPPSMAATPATPPVRPVAGANAIDLGALSPSLAGASIRFDASFLGAVLELSNLTLNAGPQAVHVVHPLFIVWSAGMKSPDPVDSFGTLDQTVPAGESAPLGPGRLFLASVGVLDQLSIGFQKVEVTGGVADGGTTDSDGGPAQGGGCKDTVDFTTDAQPTLVARCVSCHGGGNPTANAALDMSQVADPAMQAAACGQVRNKIDSNAPSMSAIFTVTDPKGMANHPFKFGGDAAAHAAFVQAASLWIAHEK